MRKRIFSLQNKRNAFYDDAEDEIAPLVSIIQQKIDVP